MTTDGHVRLLKLHGSREDWLRVILSGKSYETFGRRYPFLVSQLDVLLRQNPVLFIGCSLQDPRILDWLAGLKPDAAEALKPWRALMTQSAWDEAVEAKWDGPAGVFGRHPRCRQPGRRDRRRGRRAAWRGRAAGPCRYREGCPP